MLNMGHMVQRRRTSQSGKTTNHARVFASCAAVDWSCLPLAHARYYIQLRGNIRAAHVLQLLLILGLPGRQ